MVRCVRCAIDNVASVCGALASMEARVPEDDTPDSKSSSSSSSRGEALLAAPQLASLAVRTHISSVIVIPTAVAAVVVVVAAGSANGSG
jgi:hypothetical protein